MFNINLISFRGKSPLTPTGGLSLWTLLGALPQQPPDLSTVITYCYLHKDFIWLAQLMHLCRYRDADLQNCNGYRANSDGEFINLTT